MFFPKDTEDDTKASNVQVVVRVRPLISLEFNSESCVNVLPPHDSDEFNFGVGQVQKPQAPITSSALKIQGHNFNFDKVLDQQTTQRIFYEECVGPLVASCLKGYNATVLAYGQTGSGKTHTMLGDKEGENIGVIPRALDGLFLRLDELKNDSSCMEAETYEYEIHAQFLELYGEEIRDLLRTDSAASKSLVKKSKLTIRDGRGEGAEPEVIGATTRRIKSPNDGIRLIHEGMRRRVTGATAMNLESSRSHAIFTVVVQQIASKTVATDEVSSQTGKQGKSVTVEVKKSKFHFVDLAGSERAKRSKCEGKRLAEGININKGLLVLGNVISALGDERKKGSFIPYRDSKLTRVLKGSLGGNHRTLMIACVSPSLSNMDESLNCLRYANRAKNIQNKAVKNVDANTTKIVEELKTKVKTMSEEILTVRSHVKKMAEELLRMQHLESSDEIVSPSAFSLNELKSFAGYTDGIFFPSPVTKDNSSTVVHESGDVKLAGIDSPAIISKAEGSEDFENTLETNKGFIDMKVEENDKISGLANQSKSAASIAAEQKLAEMAKELDAVKASQGFQQTSKAGLEESQGQNANDSAEVMNKIYEFERQVALLRLSLGREIEKSSDKANSYDLSSVMDKMSIDNADQCSTSKISNLCRNPVPLCDTPLSPYVHVSTPSAYALTPSPYNNSLYADSPQYNYCSSADTALAVIHSSVSDSPLCMSNDDAYRKRSSFLMDFFGGCKEDNNKRQKVSLAAPDQVVDHTYTQQAANDMWEWWKYFFKPSLIISDKS